MHHGTLQCALKSHGFERPGPARQPGTPGVCEVSNAGPRQRTASVQLIGTPVPECFVPHSHWGYWAAGRARVPIIVPVTDDAEGHGALRFWSAVVLIYAVVATILALLRLPSPFLFAGVVPGAVGALRLPQPRPLPGRVREVGLATIGVAAGSAISREVVETILSSPLAILGGVIATLAITMAAGQLLRLSPLVNGPTAIFASIAGGASGVTAVAREMDADEAIVLSIQYLRVLFVLATVTLVAQIFGGNGSVGAVTGRAGHSLC